MRVQHFEKLRPLCPTCRAAGRPPLPLTVGSVVKQDSGDILEGILTCPSPECRREHPIIDGIPIIVADIRSYMSHQLDAIRDRSDLSDTIESLLGDCAGPNSALDQRRNQLSSYGYSHYGDLAPKTSTTDAKPGFGIANLLQSSLDALSNPPQGIWLDLGCSLGRSSIALADQTNDIVLGIDLNFAMLRLARAAVTTGQVRYPLRRVGIVYDDQNVAVPVKNPNLIDFWACDATALPFSAKHFDGACSLNVLDCVHSPLEHLSEAARVLKQDRELVLTTPYDWSTNATQLGAWIGGHSQRAPHNGSSVQTIKNLLAKTDPSYDTGLVLVRERELPWRVYVHERASMDYRCHVIVAKASAVSSNVAHDET